MKAEDVIMGVMLVLLTAERSEVSTHLVTTLVHLTLVHLTLGAQTLSILQ